MPGLGDAPEFDARVVLGSQKEYQIEFEYDGRQGTFVFRRPTLLDGLAMRVMEANLLGGTSQDAVDLFGRNLARMMSTFRHVIIRAPEWFDLQKMDDYGMLEAVYEKYVAAVKPFRPRGQGDSKAGETAVP